MTLNLTSMKNGGIAISLTNEELLTLYNLLQEEIKRNPKPTSTNVKNLYDGMKLVKKICTNEDLDNQEPQTIAEYEKSPNETLSNEDIDIFNDYLATNDIPTAMKNSDFLQIYKKITGEHITNEVLKSWAESNNE